MKTHKHFIQVNNVTTHSFIFMYILYSTYVCTYWQHFFNISEWYTRLSCIWMCEMRIHFLRLFCCWLAHIYNIYYTCSSRIAHIREKYKRTYILIWCLGAIFRLRAHIFINCAAVVNEPRLREVDWILFSFVIFKILFISSTFFYV